MDTDLILSVRRQRLAEAVLRAMDRAVASPMRWGHDDCALWCAEPIREVLGYDPAMGFRDRYTDCDSANALFGKTGLLGALRSAARRHKWRQIKPDDALVGDIGLAIVRGPEDRMIQTCMICRIQGWFVARNENGFTALQSRHVARAWAVI